MALTINRTRSPKYPNFSMRAAVKQIQKIHSADRRNVIERINAAKHMGYTALSGPAEKSIGTLVQYGLLELVGKGQVRVSQNAVDILHPVGDAEHKVALQKAAFHPEIFKSLKEQFPGGVSQESLKSYLVRQNFMDRAIDPISKAYTETCLFLEQSGANDSGRQGPEGAAESSSMDHHEDAQMEPLQQSPAPPPPSLSPAQKGVAFARMLEADGEQEWLRGPLSRELSYRILVTGEVGPREIGKLIKLLQAQQAVLQDDDDDTA